MSQQFGNDLILVMLNHDVETSTVSTNYIFLRCIPELCNVSGRASSKGLALCVWMSLVHRQYFHQFEASENCDNFDRK
jgi:hypothetical protein